MAQRKTYLICSDTSYLREQPSQPWPRNAYGPRTRRKLAMSWTGEVSGTSPFLSPRSRLCQKVETGRRNEKRTVVHHPPLQLPGEKA